MYMQLTGDREKGRFATTNEVKSVTTHEVININALMAGIRANYTVPRARQFLLTAYIPEYDEYMTQTAYLADFQPQIYGNYDGVLRYNPMRLSFIGGVYPG